MCLWCSHCPRRAPLGLGRTVTPVSTFGNVLHGIDSIRPDGQLTAWSVELDHWPKDRNHNGDHTSTLPDVAGRLETLQTRTPPQEQPQHILWKRLTSVSKYLTPKPRFNHSYIENYRWKSGSAHAMHLSRHHTSIEAFNFSSVAVYMSSSIITCFEFNSKLDCTTYANHFLFAFLIIL